MEEVVLRDDGCADVVAVGGRICGVADANVPAFCQYQTPPAMIKTTIIKIITTGTNLFRLILLNQLLL